MCVSVGGCASICESDSLYSSVLSCDANGVERVLKNPVDGVWMANENGENDEIDDSIVVCGDESMLAVNPCARGCGGGVDAEGVSKSNAGLLLSASEFGAVKKPFSRYDSIENFCLSGWIRVLVE